VGAGATRAFAALGGEALWATPGGLFAGLAGQWVGIEDASGPRRSVVDLAALDGVDGAREAWVQEGATLRRVRIDGGAAPRILWFDAAPSGVDLGAIGAIARVDGARVAALSSRCLAIVGRDQVRLFRGAASDGLPAAVGGGGGYAWVAWAGQLLRTDGERWAAIARGAALGRGARIAVDGGAGTAALVVDDEGALFRVEAASALRLSGLRDGDAITDTRLELEATTPGPGFRGSVTFAIDGRPLATRAEPPWGWGEGGARSRDLRELSFGAHRVTVVARAEVGAALQRSLRITYVSALRRVPTYEVDVAPIYAAHCARCHDNGAAHDLRGYDAFSGERSRVRAAVREGRMPPDILLDGVSTAVMTAWLDGGTPR
jgi:hypothetical protein